MLEIGSLVKWFEPYADGIIKDTGTGIVLNSRSHKFGNKTIATYEVYRTKYNDKMRFEEYELEIKND